MRTPNSVSDVGVYPYQEVTALRKAGRLDEAYRRARELLNEHPDDRYLKSSFGWVFYAKIKEIVAAARDGTTEGNAAAPTIRNILREYASLRLPTPDLLFSLLLVQVLRCPTSPEFLPGLMVWAGLECFRTEDLRADHGEDGAVYEPLIEKVARKTAKVARASDDPRLKEHAVLLLDKAIAEGEVQKLEWLHYGKALLLGQLGRSKEAQELLIPFVREKQADFWAWHALAKLEEPTDPQLALALCAKATQACNDPQFGLHVFEDLSRLAAIHGQLGLAKWAADRAVSVREENDWRLPQSLRDLLASDWYAQAENLANPAEALEACASGAEKIIYAACPHCDATYLGTFTAKSGKVMAKVAARHQDEVEELVSPARELVDAKAFSVGDPVTVGILGGTNRSSIIEISRRETGIPFDCLQEVHGVVDHQNRDKGLTSLYLTETDFCLLHYQDFPKAHGWTPGTAVTIRCLRSDRGTRAYSAEKIPLEENQWMTRVEGAISIHEKGFGFVNHDVFIPPPLARNYEDGQEVSLIAVKKRNKKTGKLGWTAIGSVTAVVVDMNEYRKHG